MSGPSDRRPPSTPPTEHPREGVVMLVLMGVLFVVSLVAVLLLA